MDRITARLSSRFLSYGLPFLYLLTSIAFYLHTYDSAQVKITIVQMFGTVLIGFWYVTLACEKGVSWQKYGPIALPLLCALASGLLSFSHAAYQGPSLDECLRRVFYIHFALIALKEINTLERLKRMVLYLLIATAIATVYGLIQFLDFRFFIGQPSGLDPFVWRLAFGDRIFSTFGNPNFFGNFLVILTPITLALLFKRHSDKPAGILLFAILVNVAAATAWQANRVMELFHADAWSNAYVVIVLLAMAIFAMIRFSFLGLLFLLITLCNDVTQSKGAWVGYAASFMSFMMLVLFFFSQFQSDWMRRNIRRASVTVLLLAGLGVGFYSHQRVDSIRFRICTWVSTWEMAQMHPLWGNGIGSFRILYPAFRRPQIFHIEGKHNTETDHSEDEYWEVLQDEGLLGFGIFIWMILTFSIMGVRGLSRFTEGLSTKDIGSGKRKISSDPRAFYMLGLLSAFWGMLIHNFMDVSLRFVSSGIFLWLLAGLIGAMVVHDPLPETDAIRESREPKEDPVPGHPSWFLMIGMAATAILFVHQAYGMYVLFNDTQGASPDASGELLLWAIAWAAFIFTVGGVLYAIYRVSLSLKHVYGFILLCCMLPPLNVFWGWFMADVYHNRGIYFSKNGNWQSAIDNYQKVVDNNPNYIMAYYFMGNVYTDRWQPGDFEKAMEQYKKVWAIAPNYVQSHHQAGLVYLKKGQYDRAEADTLRSQGKSAEAVSALLAAKADWEEALVYFKKYHDIDPVFEPNYTREGWVHLQLADIAKQMGDAQAVERHYEAAESAYEESLNATICGIPSNDVLHEHWWRTHRHYSSDMYKNLGDVRFLRGNLAGAERAYLMSLNQDPNNKDSMKNLVSVYARLGRPADGYRILNRLRAIAPQDPDLQRLTGHATPSTSHP